MSGISRREMLAGAAALAGATVAGTPAIAAAKDGGRRRGRLPAETIAARLHYFGFDNVDRNGHVRDDRVLLSWTGEAGFAAALNGHVVLLDSWVSRGDDISMRYVGSTPDELAALRPEVVFTGHNHFDHVGDLPTVVRGNPGITVVDSEEGNQDLRAEVGDARFRALSAFPAGAPLASQTDLSHLLGGVGITAIKHPHSGATPGETPIQAPPDDIAQQQYPPAADEPASYAGPNSGPIAILYQFSIGDFALLWHNTSGPRNDAVLARLRKLPRTTVEIGSIVSAGGNGIQDCGRYTSALRPRVFVPMHHDNFPVVSRGEFYRPFVQESLAAMDPSPALLFLCNPGDYLRALSFSAG